MRPYFLCRIIGRKLSSNGCSGETTKKVTPTSINLWVLSQTFKDGVDAAPNRATPNRRRHLLRLVRAGLVEVAGDTLRLTAAGRAALPTRREENSNGQ